MDRKNAKFLRTPILSTLFRKKYGGILHTKSEEQRKRRTLGNEVRQKIRKKQSEFTVTYARAVIKISKKY